MYIQPNRKKDVRSWIFSRSLFLSLGNHKENLSRLTSSQEEIPVIGLSYFYFVANMDRAVRTTMEAIAEWESKTCIRFVKRTTEKEYLWFHRGNG